MGEADSDLPLVVFDVARIAPATLLDLFMEPAVVDRETSTIDAIRLLLFKKIES